MPTKQSARLLKQDTLGNGNKGAGHLVFSIFKRRPVRISLIVILLVSVAGALAIYVLPAHAGTKTAQATLYGPDNAKVLAAVQAAQWPQQKNNWCGVATIAAIAQFRGQAISQQNVADYLNSAAAVSIWGTPGSSPTAWGPAFKADIARDVGTDPRSLATGLSAEGQGHYHQLVALNGSYDATLHLVADLVRTQEPISVIVYHGLHSVLVSGVEATGDPVTNPGSITGLEVWDPGYGIPNGNIQNAQEVLVPLNTWLTNQYYWGSPYSANYFGSIAADPDPSVGTPYTYDPTQSDNGHLWIGHYVYFRQDASTDPSLNVTTDWAFSQAGALIEGFHGEVPSGYTGPITSIPNPFTMNDNSIDAPAFWSESAYPPVANSSFAPVSVLAWAGTDRAHSLNVETSNDGIHYTNKITLGDNSFARPSILVVPVNTTNVVIMAWAGNDRNHSLNVMYDVYGARKKVTFAEYTPFAPSLAYFGGQVWIAWAGTDANHTLNVRALGPQGLVPGVKTTLWSHDSGSSPDLVADPHDSQMLLSWQMSGSNHPNFMQSANGTTWTAGLAAPSSGTTGSTPSLMALNPAQTNMPEYYWAWTGTNSSRTVYIQMTSTLNTWSSPIVALPEAATGAPSLGFAGQARQILIVWTGTDSGHHLNVAILPV